MQKIKKKIHAAKQQPEQEMKTIAHHIFLFMKTYKKYFIAAGAAVAAAVVIASGYAITRFFQERQAGPLIAAANEYYHGENGMAVDYQKALALFRDVQKKYPNTMSGSIAQYSIGNCLADLGQIDEAIKEYQYFIKEYSGEKVLLGLVYQRLGYVQSGLGKQADAIQAFERAEALIGPGVSTIELARLYEATGNIAESQKKYKLVMDKLRGSRWVVEAMRKVQPMEPMPALGAEPAAK